MQHGGLLSTHGRGLLSNCGMWICSSLMAIFTGAYLQLWHGSPLSLVAVLASSFVMIRVGVPL